MATTDSLPVPRKNVAFRAHFDLRLNTGALNSGAAGLDSEVSKDDGTFTDCTNEATEVATSSGHYYLDLTSTEMNADSVVVQIKSSTTNAVTRTIILHPQETGDIKVDVTSFGGTAGTFSGGRPEVNTTHVGGTLQTARDIGASVLLSSGTGTGQVTLTSGRVNADLTHIATVAVSTSTAQLGVNVVNFGGSAGTFSSGRPEVNTTHFGGTAGTFASGVPDANALALKTQAKADVNAEVVDAVNVDTIAEMGAGAPPASPTMRQMLNYMYRWLIRNKKTVDSSSSPTVETVLADDGSTPLFKRDISDSANITTFDETVSG